MSPGDDLDTQEKSDSEGFINYKVKGKPEKNKLGSRQRRNQLKSIVRALGNQRGVSGKLIGDLIEEEKKAFGLKGSQHGKPTEEGLDFGDDTIHLDA